MIAVAAAREQTTPQQLPTRAPRPAPELARMTGPELCGLACVLCHQPLPPTWRAARLLDVIEDTRGHRYGRWACAPACPGTPPPAPRPFLSAKLPRWPISDRARPLWQVARADDPATIRRVLDHLRRLPDTHPPP